MEVTNKTSAAHCCECCGEEPKFYLFNFQDRWICENCIKKAVESVEMRCKYDFDDVTAINNHD